MFKLTTLVSSFLIGLMAWRGIRCLETLPGFTPLPKLAEVYAGSYAVVASVLGAMFVIATVQRFYARKDSPFDWQKVTLMAMQFHTLAGVSGFLVTVFDRCHMLGHH